MVAISSSNQVGNVIGFGGVSLAGMLDEDSHYPFNLNGSLVLANVGFAVALDTGAATTVKLTGDNDIVLGRLETFEARTTEGINVGVVCTEGGVTLPFDNSGTNSVVLGGSVQGSATPGKVKNLAAAQGRSNVVVAVDNVNTICTILFL